MKKLHLLCNAHLDPAWLWQWNEGLAEAISTFRVAADFCEKYDAFVFNHNEALLYEWVEEHEPELFLRIKKLVSEKKWMIMGGWYLQPDCVMTSGESLMEQIRLGREYFEEKFGVRPTTAINFDPFGHSRGLVQILKNAGYDSYIFMRPGNFDREFIWEGFDGSKVIAHSVYRSYNSARGKATEKIEHFLDSQKDRETELCLWGIGNHGGGPSRIDIENINDFIKESDVEIIHSFAENYFKEIDKSKLNTVSESLIPSMVGCYTSMVRVKQANRRLENKISITEKIMSYADMQSGVVFDYDELKKAKKALAFCQFHDILPGSAIKPVEDDSLRAFAYGEEIADKLYNKAFFNLCCEQKKAKDGEIPIMVFNPHPYEIEGEFEVGFMLQDQNWNEDEETLAYIFDEDGNEVLSQNEKPECTFNLDWIQKVSFRAKVKPSSITRFDCRLNTVKKTGKEKFEPTELIKIENERMKAHISTKTGLIALFEVDGKRLVENSGIIEVYHDNEDPWGMTVDSFKEFEDAFSLMSDAEANEFIGYPKEECPNVRIVEDGKVRTKIQAFFKYKRSVAIVEYTIPKMGAYIDINITLHSNEVCKMLKYRVDTLFSGTPYGQTAFGYEPLFDDEKEAVYHKWCGIKGDDAKLYVVNNGTYGGSFTKSSVKLSLLRTPMYAAHPIGKRQIAPHDRYINHMDLGERSFSFRITTEDNIEKEAQIFNEAPTLLSFFPSGEGNTKGSVIKIDNPAVLLSSLKKNDSGYEAVWFNSSDNDEEATVMLDSLNKEFNLKFRKFEIKTISIDM